MEHSLFLGHLYKMEGGDSVGTRLGHMVCIKNLESKLPP